MYAHTLSSVVYLRLNDRQGVWGCWPTHPAPCNCVYWNLSLYMLDIVPYFGRWIHLIRFQNEGEEIDISLTVCVTLYKLSTTNPNVVLRWNRTCRMYTFFGKPHVTLGVRWYLHQNCASLINEGHWVAVWFPKPQIHLLMNQFFKWNMMC